MRRLIQALVVLVLASVSGWSQVTGELISKTLGRGDSVSIVVKNLPENAKATGIRFDSMDNAQTWTAEGETIQQTADAADKKKITVTGQVRPDAALTDYRLSVIFDNKSVVLVPGKLSV